MPGQDHAAKRAKRGHPAFSGLSRLRSGLGSEKTRDGGTIPSEARIERKKLGVPVLRLRAADRIRSELLSKGMSL